MQLKLLLNCNVFAVISAICYWFIGYSLAFGSGSSILGLGDYIAGYGLASAAVFSHWFFQFVFAATAATIVSGAVAERCTFTAYLVYSAFISGTSLLQGVTHTF
jgi:Amt family ammonium transporter